MIIKSSLVKLLILDCGGWETK
jgi:hypothetical protein